MELWLALLLALIAFGFAVLWRREARSRRWSEAGLRTEIDALRMQVDALQEGMDRIQPALVVSNDLMLATDSDLRVRFANPAAERQFGNLENAATLIGYTHNLELERLAQDALETESADGLSRNLRIEDRPFEARAMRLGQGVGLALSDVAELQRLSRARQDFIANLSHELNTPLTSLRLLLDTMLSKAGADLKMADELANKMAIEVDALQQMTEEMLDLAAIESGMQVVRLVDVPLWDLAMETMVRQRDQAARKAIQIAMDVDEGLKVLADPKQAGRAILNVLNNAVKFTPEGGEIRIQGEHDSEQDMVILTVIDTGPGIPPAELGRIFERFYRIDGSQHSPGTGLGLAISHHIMRAHAGRIWAENQKPPKRGAVFHLAFQPA
ncbi:MAG: sensor histidine kinase [Anaerolineales bacterium]